MALNIRRLGIKDGKTLSVLAKDDADFDVHGRGKPLKALNGAALRRYLGNPYLCHWVAEEKGEILGFLCGYFLPLRTQKTDEFLLYEIGVRQTHRLRGIGRALMGGLYRWMKTKRVKVVWVIADNPGAFNFYRKCGFKKVPGTLTQMERHLV